MLRRHGGGGKTAVNGAVNIAKGTANMVVQVAADTKTVLIDVPAAGFNAATNMVSTEFCAYYWDLSKEDTRAMHEVYQQKDLEEFLGVRHIGSQAWGNATDSFDEVHRGAGELTAAGVAWLIGEGWTSWTAGKLGEGVASIFTGLGNGISQLADPNATAGDKVEGVLNVGLSFTGANTVAGLLANLNVVSATVKNELTKIAGDAVDKYADKVDQADEVTDTIDQGDSQDVTVSNATIADALSDLASTTGVGNVVNVVIDNEAVDAVIDMVNQGFLGLGGEVEPVEAEEEEPAEAEAEIVDTYTVYYDSGQILLETVSYSDGRVVSTSYYENGQKASESSGIIPWGGSIWSFVNDGVATQWYSNGQIYRQSEYKNGRKVGLRTTWFESGGKWVEEHYEHGQLNGMRTLYHENGQKAFEVNYKNGVKHGIQTWYYNGSIESQVQYENGKVASTVYFTPEGRKYKRAGGQTIYLDKFPPLDVDASDLPSTTTYISEQELLAGGGGDGGGGGHGH